MKKKLFLFACLILGLMTSCENKDKEPTRNEENGHEWVDLGLSVKWATMNVGATKPEEYGDYFAWGETTPKATYTKENYTYKENPKSLPLSVDAANANWGGNWRLPTSKELRELVDNCIWTWTIQNGHKGYIVTSKKNNQSIFLPAAGCRNVGTRTIDEGVSGSCWSYTPYGSSTQDVYDIFFCEATFYVSWSKRYLGRSVRPVLLD
jgi:hypothetical protein